MKYCAHDYQAYATEFVLSHPYCGLILDMGLGKSVITLTALWDLLLDSFDVGCVLVVAPKRVAEDTWPREIAKWEHLKGLTYSLVMGSEKERRAALSRRAMIYIINRENVSWLVEHTTWRFDALVIDELSSFKSSKAQRFKALKKVRPLCSRVIGLTGTPAPNTLIDLWPQMYLLDMGQRLGRFLTHYRERFFVPDKRNREIVYSYKLREGAEQKIYELIGDICISMKATDHLKMPELTMNRVEVHLSAQEQKLYDTLKREMILQLKDGEIDAVNAAALSGKLLQMANGAVYDSQGRTVAIHDRKLDALEDLREAALEAFSALTESAEEGAQALCDIYRAQADQVTLSLRLGGRAGVPGPEDNADITRAVLLPLVNQAQVFYDARGCTGVRMTLRVG